MATLKRNFRGNFEDTKSFFKNYMDKKFLTSTFEDEVENNVNGVNIWTGVFEKYYLWGGNRMSLTVVIIEENNNIVCNMITSGGSTGAIFKMDTYGEQQFLVDILYDVDNYIKESEEKLK